MRWVNNLVAEVGVAGKVSMNFEFIESRKAGDKVVKFRRVGIADEEIVHDKGEGGGVWWRRSMGVDV
jgi:hypothetical protein